MKLLNVHLLYLPFLTCTPSVLQPVTRTTSSISQHCGCSVLSKWAEALSGSQQTPPGVPDPRTTKIARHPASPRARGRVLQEGSVSDNARVCVAAQGGLASGCRIKKEPIYSEEPLPSATHALAGCVAGLKSAYTPLFTSSASPVALSVFSASLC